MKNSGSKQGVKRGFLIRVLAVILKFMITVLGLFVLVAGGINLLMVFSTSGRILTLDEAEQLEDVDYILVLGASVRGKEPSTMLRDRLDTGIDLYESEVSDKMLMSGDGSGDYYDEVGTMKLYAAEAGVPEEQIATDPLGLCTYDSMERAVDEYGADKIVIVTQKYHMYRALYIAKKLGLDAYGVPADASDYKNQSSREIREIAARCKDFFMLWFGADTDSTMGKLTQRMEELTRRY